ncbi:MAG: hypothetical protein E7290_10730 [Lachnospiraceae bacterium]|nr:hypothetical protein [Lachnospiraceae bacterium]
MRLNINAFKREEIVLSKILKPIRERIAKAPKGFLRISKRNNRIEYYCKEEGRPGQNGRYLRKNEIELAKQLAQRDYDIQILKAAETRKKAIEHLVKVYEQTDLGEIYRKTNQYRKALITPVEISDEEYIRRWQEVDYPRMGFDENAPEYITERGERVRSKSEKIIADKLNSLGIPYRYEYPLVLNGNITRRPDFMILKMPERKEVYLEHLGMLDKPDYLEDAVYKWNLYEKNGLYLGETFFFTHETSKYPLNTRALDEMLRKLFG